MKLRLAYLASHPIQYHAPLLRRIAAEPDIDLVAFFASDLSTRPHVDKGFGVTIQWDCQLVEGYKHEFLPVLYGRDQITLCRPLNTSLARRLRQGRFDALWVNGYARPQNWHAIIIAKRLGMRVLVRDDVTLVGEGRSPLRRALKRRLFASLFRKCDFLAVGTLNYEFYRHYGVDDARNWLMPFAVDNDFFHQGAIRAAAERQEFRASLGLQEGRPVILFSAKLQDCKRPLDLLEAYAGLSENGQEPHPYLLFVGDGELRGTLESRARSTGWKSVYFLGFRNQSQLPQFYDLCDVFVLPSGRERFALAVNEVMNAAKPVIVSNCVGCAPDLVHDGENGFVYPAGEVTTLRDRLSRLLSNADLAQNMGQRSLELIGKWSIEEDVSILRRALGMDARGRRPLPFGRQPTVEHTACIG